MSSFAPETSVGLTNAVLVALQLILGCGNSGASASPASAGTTAQPTTGYGGAFQSSAAGRTATGSSGTNTTATGDGGSSGQSTMVPDPTALDGSAHPADGGVATLGGTMTFLNVGAEGFWPRRLDRDPSDPACTVKSGKDTWGGPCCLTAHATASSNLTPFDAEMTLLLKAVRVRQLAVYQPTAVAGSDFRLVSSFDDRSGTSRNLWATQSGNGSRVFPGDFTGNDCVWYVAQEGAFDCGDGRDYFCPNDPGIKHLGWSGSKLVVLLASMHVDDQALKACGSDGPGAPAPWIAFAATELTRDGGRKWNGLCNCYSKTGTVGDGCGEINLFEVVMDGNSYSNREFISTGVRSYQSGHVGGNVCGTGCSRAEFPVQQDVVNACTKTAYSKGPTLTMGGTVDGCPVWVRPEGDRYLIALLDAERRIIQVAMIHPQALPQSLGALLPALPAQLSRATVQAIAELRLPVGG